MRSLWPVGWLFLFVILGLLLSSCQSSVLLKPEPVSVSLPALEQNALIYVAASKGYFRDYGLDVTLQDTDSGVTSMDALLKNHADLAVAAEFPVVRSILGRGRVAVLASIDQFENDSLVVRGDHGIARPADLKGKRVGLALDTINEFYLGRFLELNGIPIQAVTLVDLKPERFVSAISNGEVDAVVVWQPYVSRIQEELKDATVWPVQSNQPVYGLLVARKDWLARRASTTTRFLSALGQAEDYVARHPAEAQAIVQKRLKYEQDYIQKVWVDHQFGLSLDYSLVIAMTDEARWLMKNNLSSEKTVPDFINWLYLDGLKTVKPEAVDIHR